MIQLDFKGPYDLDSFLNIVKKEDVNIPGIYIWGFKDIIEDSNKVVPYYVGIKIDSILSRIKKHVSDIKSNNSTYLRLSEKYMHLYFYANSVNAISPAFPFLKGTERKTKPLNWLGWDNTDFFNHIEYYNNSDFLSNIKKCEQPIIQLGNRKEFPISNLTNLNDALLNRINVNNFWIYYAAIDIKSDDYKEFRNTNSKNIKSIKNKDRAAFEIMESYVKFSLKGNTIGHSSPFDCWCGFPKIKINGITNLFKDNPSIVFNGNY